VRGKKLGVLNDAMFDSPGCDERPVDFLPVCEASVKSSKGGPKLREPTVAELLFRYAWLPLEEYYHSVDRLFRHFYSDSRIEEFCKHRSFAFDVPVKINGISAITIRLVGSLKY
jgi:hypothetical protein